MTVTKEDADLLERIGYQFSENIKKNYQGNAVRAFEKAVKWHEVPKIIAARIAAESSKSGDPEARIRTMAALYNAALPVLKRTFSEEFLIASLPPAARDQHVVDLCENAGSAGVADLCRKAMGRSPS